MVEPAHRHVPRIADDVDEARFREQAQQVAEELMVAGGLVADRLGGRRRALAHQVDHQAAREAVDHRVRQAGVVGAALVHAIGHQAHVAAVLRLHAAQGGVQALDEMAFTRADGLGMGVEELLQPSRARLGGAADEEHAGDALDPATTGAAQARRRAKKKGRSKAALSLFRRWCQPAIVLPRPYRHREPWYAVAALSSSTQYAPHWRGTR